MFTSAKQEYKSAYRDVRLASQRPIPTRAYGNPVSMRFYLAAEESRFQYMRGIPDFKVQHFVKAFRAYQLIRQHRQNRRICPCRICHTYFEWSV